MTETQHDADTLARFLDGDGSLNGRVTDETRALAGLAHRLESAAAQPAPSRRRELRDELLEAARERQAAPSLHVRLRRWLGREQPRRPRVPAVPRLAAIRTAAAPRMAALVGAAIVAVSGGGLAYGAEAALPGDALYSVKLAVEDTRLAFEGDRSARGTMYLERAAERISEAEASAANGNHRGVALALRHANDSVRAGAGAILFSYRAEQDPALINRLAAFTTTQSGRLTNLASGLDGEAAEAAASTLVAFEQIQAQATALGGACPRCDDPAPVSDHGNDSEARKTPTQVRPFESPERTDRSSDVQPSQPPDTGPATPPRRLPPPQPQDAAPEPPSTEDPTDAPANVPATPDAEAPVDPPEPDAETDADDLVPEPPDLPF